MEDETKGTSERRLGRLLDTAATPRSETDEILYQHSVLCQTTLPYRNPGDDIRTWKRTNGAVHLAISAGLALHPEQGELVEIGLPYGPKSRLILAHLNTEALRQGASVIEVGASLTGFVKRLGLDPKGRNVGIIKDQLARLAASRVTFGTITDGQALTVNSQIVTAFNLWFPKEDGQRVLWPSTVRLSPEYFESLTKHAVPLDERALAVLSGSAMALDVYAWLAQRLHRIDWGKRVFVPWPALHDQFGWEYDRLRDFRRVFQQTLRVVHSQYRAAAVDLDLSGMTLRHSPTPVKGRTGIVVRVP